jgi:hypothetical protein
LRELPTVGDVRDGGNRAVCTDAAVSRLPSGKSNDQNLWMGLGEAALLGRTFPRMI